MPRVNGVQFRCSCGCNVFTHKDHIYTCNACQLEYTDHFGMIQDDVSPVAGMNIRIQAAYKYLGGLGVTLWGDYDISIVDRKVEAAKWLARQVEGVQNVLMDGRWNPE